MNINYMLRNCFLISHGFLHHNEDLRMQLTIYVTLIYYSVVLTPIYALLKLRII